MRRFRCVYNPGAYGILQGRAVHSFAFREVAPGQTRLVLDATRSSRDADRGTNSFEATSSRLVRLCGRPASPLACDESLEIAHDDISGALEPDRPRPTAEASDAPSAPAVRFEIELRFEPAGQVTLTRVRGDVPPSYAPRLGTHPFGEDFR